MVEPAGGGNAPAVARVLLDSALPQLDHLFDYEVLPEHRDEIRVGHRVKVPFRSRQRNTTGTVIELQEETDFGGTLQPISEIISPVPQLTPEVWRLIRAVADRAGGSAADIIRLAIPARYVRVEKRFLADRASGAAVEPVKRTLKREPTDQELERAHALVAGARVSMRVRQSPVRLPQGEWVSAWAVQAAHLAAAIHSLDHSVIIVVPDYRDLDQVHDTLTSLGLREHVRLDARQPAGERYLNFLHALEEQPRIILGNRSAVYAPAHNLGAIIMWNDADPVLAEPLTPYVHARDAALIRSTQSGAGLLFLSHVRSAEMQRLINIDYVTAQEQGHEHPRIVHTGSLTQSEPTLGRIPELATKTIREHLPHGPVLVQVAMPGYAPTLVCARCHDRARCCSCRGPLALSSGREAGCRWCGQAARAWSCGTCDATQFEPRGAGSERTAEQFQRMFPETKVIVSDGAHARSRVDARPALVVATRGAEPIADGGYRAVILLDVDTILGAETLRAGEDALRWWHGAVSLAASGAPCVITGGGGAVVRAFVTGREEDWLQHELRDRTLLRFPPAVRVASVTGSPEVVARACETVSDLPSVDILGPAPHGTGRVRAIVRFGYDDGAEVATRLRAELITNASTSRSQPRDRYAERQRRGAPLGALKLRFDDRGAFDDTGEQTGESGQ